MIEIRESWPLWGMTRSQAKLIRKGHKGPSWGNRNVLDFALGDKYDGCVQLTKLITLNTEEPYIYCM